MPPHSLHRPIHHLIRALTSPKPLPCPRPCRPFSTRAAGLRTNHPTSAPQFPPSPPPPPASKSQTRIDRLLSRLPPYLQRHLAPLRTAPLTHITSFLILHELTAIVPLFGLAATFHYTNWIPTWFAEGKWVADGVKRMAGWLRRRGWVDDDLRGRKGWWGKGEKGVRWVVELGTAWAVTKALLPVRLLVSVWLTPAFARGVLGPVGRGLRRLVGRGKGRGGGGGG